MLAGDELLVSDQKKNHSIHPYIRKSEGLHGIDRIHHTPDPGDIFYSKSKINL
jgi:hypothetical protein